MAIDKDVPFLNWKQMFSFKSGNLNFVKLLNAERISSPNLQAAKKKKKKKKKITTILFYLRSREIKIAKRPQILSNVMSFLIPHQNRIITLTKVLANC